MPTFLARFGKGRPIRFLLAQGPFIYDNLKIVVFWIPSSSPYLNLLPSLLCLLFGNSLCGRHMCFFPYRVSHFCMTFQQVALGIPGVVTAYTLAYANSTLERNFLGDRMASFQVAQRVAGPHASCRYWTSHVQSWIFQTGLVNVKYRQNSSNL